ncbi:hypothetical protein N0V90_008903 [Kalmusia sp. IMI 367209]|nr:hypothetical protein N0V90_008903 [Kalmusia sp. IMI 367209]
MEEPSSSEPTLYNSLPIDEDHWTRLLMLRQGIPDDPIECLLLPSNLDALHDEDETLPPYETLSYVWGDRTGLCEISCNETPIEVTRNLFDALVAIRRPTTARLLWVDAICINQEDVEERNRQVALMASIYRQASRVLIWLGHGDTQYVDPAFTYLCQRANKVYLDLGWTRRLFKVRLASYTTRGEEIDSSRLQLDDVRPTAAQYEAFAAFLRQPWFFRLWVIQEVSLAKTATLFWHESSIDLAFVMVALDTWRDDNRQFPPPVGLDNINYSGVSLLPSLPNDGIDISVQSLGTDPENDLLFIQPDYNMPVLELYEQVAKKMILEQKQPYLLSAVYHDREINDGLPSWVPDWSKPAPALDTMTIGRGVYMYKGPVTDDYGVDVSLVKKEGREYLVIAGHDIDNVENVTQVIRASDIMDGFSKEDSVLLKKELKEICKKFKANDILKAMTRNRVYPQELLASYPEPLFGYDDLYSFLTELSTTKDTHDFEGYEELVGNFRSMLASLCDGRRLFTFEPFEWYTETSRFVKQRIGSAPEIVQKGDTVCLLFGAFDIYLLRHDGDDHMRLLGSCDVAGYNYELNVAVHKFTKRPMDYFEIF